MTGCGQDRPRHGQHLSAPDPVEQLFVVTDANGALTEDDAAVLERFFTAKLAEVTTWKIRAAQPPYANGVGDERFGDLMQMGTETLCLLKLQFGLFADVSDRRLISTPREFEPMIWDYLRHGVPKGEEKLLQGFGVTAFGIDLGDDGFVIRAGSQVRSRVVGSAAGLTSARREEGYFNGLLVRGPEGIFIVNRDLWRPSATSAAKFVTGSSASASNWQPISPPRPRLA